MAEFPGFGGSYIEVDASIDRGAMLDSVYDEGSDYIISGAGLDPVVIAERGHVLSRRDAIGISLDPTVLAWSFSVDGGTRWIDGGSPFYGVSRSDAAFATILAADMAEGSYPANHIRIRQTDLFGNLREDILLHPAFVVDLTPPASTLALRLAADTGLSATDRITFNGRIQVEGLTPGDQWYYKVDDEPWRRGAGSAFDLAPAPTGAAASRTIYVRQGDFAGNLTPAVSINVVLDTQAITPLVRPQFDSGYKNYSATYVDNVSSSRFYISAETGNFRVSTDRGATWSLPRSTNTLQSLLSYKGIDEGYIVLPDGKYLPGDIRVESVDIAGNTSAVYLYDRAITVDTLSPQAVQLTLVEDTGISDATRQDRITSNNRINVTGLEAAAAWEYSIDRGMTWSPGQGSQFSVPRGRYLQGDVLVNQYDGAGNVQVSQPFAAFEYTDLQPAAPSYYDILADTGSSSADRVTNNGRVVVSGLEPGAKLEYSFGAAGNWLAATGNSFDLPVGSYQAGQVRVRQVSSTGLVSQINSSMPAVRVMNWFDLNQSVYTKNMRGEDFLWNDGATQKRIASSVRFLSSSPSLANGKPTYVYSHGWQDSSTSSSSTVLYRKLTQRLGDTANVVLVDWSQLAKLVSSIMPPHAECSVTDQVGRIVADALYGAGVDVSQLHLIGHSLGSYVMAAASKSLQWIGLPATYTALDPAYTPFDGYILDAYAGTDDAAKTAYRQLRFDSLARETYSYTASDLPGGVSSIAGDNDKAATAGNAYIVQYDSQEPPSWPSSLLAGGIASVFSPGYGLAKAFALEAWNEVQRSPIATAYHNGTIGVYADLFFKGRWRAPSSDEYSYGGSEYKFTFDLTDAYDNKGLGFQDANIDASRKLFDGVVLAPQPWVGNANEPTGDLLGRRVPSAYGWFSGNSGGDYHSLLGSAASDVIHFGYITDSIVSRWPTGYVGVHPGLGNDIIVGDYGKHWIDVGGDSDTVIFGYRKDGANEYAYDDGTGGAWIGDHGLSSYGVIANFGAGDRLSFPWIRDDIGYKPGSQYALGAPMQTDWGDGLAVYKKVRTFQVLPVPWVYEASDLIAYLPGVTASGFESAINSGLVTFGSDFYDLDRALLV